MAVRPQPSRVAECQPIGGRCCRVLDALSRGITKPGIFEQADKQHFLELFADAADQFEHAHEATYMGRGDLLRRFVNRQK